MIVKFIKRNMLPIIGAVVGAAGGYLYWMTVGCASGTCPITSSPINSSIWGAAVGALLLDLFRNRKTERENG